MPIDDVGDVVVGALEAAGDFALGEPRKRSRRLMYWTTVALVLGVFGFGAYLALS